MVMRYVNSPQKDLPAFKSKVLSEPHVSKGELRIAYLKSSLEKLLKVQISDLLNLESDSGICILTSTPMIYRNSEV